MNKDNNQCRIDFISSQIRENRITHHMLLKELNSVKNILFAYDLWSKIDKTLSYSKYKQEPVYGDIGNLDIQFNGDFIFVVKN